METQLPIMTKDEKLDLQWKVRFCIGQGLTLEQTVKKLAPYGFTKATISKYYNALK